MSHMTKIPGVPDRDDVRPGMAHLPGTGPKGSTCGDCVFRGYYKQSYRNGVKKPMHVKGCEMYKKLSGGIHGPPVQTWYRSCKYFEPLQTEMRL